MAEVKLFDATEVFEAEGAVLGAIYAGIDFGEGMEVWGEARFDGSVINGSELAHVEGGGVAFEASDVEEPDFEGFDAMGSDVGEGDVGLSAVALEDGEGVAVVIGEGGLGTIAEGLGEGEKVRGEGGKVRRCLRWGGIVFGG